MGLTDRTRPVVMAFMRLMNQWKACDRLDHELAGETFTAGELQTLKVVAEFPARNTTELAETLGVTKGAVSQSVTRLVKRGFLERYRAPENERESFTRLTVRGSEVYRAHMEEMEDQVMAFDALLADAEPACIDWMLDFVARAEAFFREQANSREQ